MPLDTIYVVVSGAGTARRVPGLLPCLVALAPRVLTILTSNAQRVVSPRELALVPGHQIVESYFDEAILPRPSRGVVLFVPCGFNSLNKLASGIADNLALSVVAEAIGRRTPVVVAISVNNPLWDHPITARSAATLRSWGCRVIDPVLDGEYLTLASDDAIVEAAPAGAVLYVILSVGRRIGCYYKRSFFHGADPSLDAQDDRRPQPPGVRTTWTDVTAATAGDRSWCR